MVFVEYSFRLSRCKFMLTKMSVLCQMKLFCHFLKNINFPEAVVECRNFLLDIIHSGFSLSLQVLSWHAMPSRVVWDNTFLFCSVLPFFLPSFSFSFYFFGERFPCESFIRQGWVLAVWRLLPERNIKWIFVCWSKFMTLKFDKNVIKRAFA